ncbi:hypothetical protein [Acetobacter fallax]|uniref:Uncharacterized protein n=1 Tax=Acetobacter fallax TaxID=1737473 RepID=A0ABX0KGF3_9PROT|nr:hypothetical protein [Acetobacter fallax]NHO33002.1 hypothetical protein [Acetobacter fallax]
MRCIPVCFACAQAGGFVVGQGGYGTIRVTGSQGEARSGKGAAGLMPVLMKTGNMRDFRYAGDIDDQGESGAPSLGVPALSVTVQGVRSAGGDVGKDIVRTEDGITHGAVFSSSGYFSRC